MTLVAESVRIRVHATSGRLSQGLSRDAAPYLTPEPPAKDNMPAEVVRVAISSVLAGGLANLTARAARAGLPSFQTFGRFHLAHKAAAVSGGPLSQAFIMWSATTPHVTNVLLAGTDTASQRLLLRIVRAITTRALLDAGWTPLHASCAVTPGGTICLLGCHSSGKTTALLSLLASGRGQTGFLANNAVFLMPGRSEVRARGLPTAAAIRAPTLRMFPELATTTLRTITQVGASVCGPDAGQADDRVTLTPHQLTKEFRAPLIPCSTLTALIAVNHDPQASAAPWQSRCTMSTRQQARELCHAAYITDWLADDPYELARLAADAPTLRRRHSDALNAATQLVPCADFRSAPGTVTGDELLRVLAALVGRGRSDETVDEPVVQLP